MSNGLTFDGEVSFEYPDRVLPYSMQEGKSYVPNLPNDVCRCHDEQCHERLTCRRFLQRDKGGVNVVRAATLRKLLGKPCEMKMEVS